RLLGSFWGVSGCRIVNIRAEDLDAGWASAISRNGTLWNVAAETTGSICLDAGELHHLAPLLRFFGDEPSKADSRHRHRYTTPIGHPCLQLRIGEPRIDLLVERLDDLSRRVFRHADAEPETRFVARHKLSHGRDLRQYVQARPASHRERAQLASPDILYRCGRAGEVDLHLPAEQIGERGSRAAIRYVHEVHPGHHLEQLARNVASGAGARRRHV